MTQSNTAIPIFEFAIFINKIFVIWIWIWIDIDGWTAGKAKLKNNKQKAQISYARYIFNTMRDQSDSLLLRYIYSKLLIILPASTYNRTKIMKFHDNSTQNIIK